MALEMVFLLEIMYNSTMRSLDDIGLRDDSLPQIAQVKFAHFSKLMSSYSGPFKYCAQSCTYSLQ